MQKSLRTMLPLALTYQFEFAGCTGKGHYRWTHKPTGRSMVTVRDQGSFHSLKNTERDFKRRVREFMEQADG